MVQSAAGFSVVWVHFEPEVPRFIGTRPPAMTREQARRIAAQIAKLGRVPEDISEADKKAVWKILGPMTSPAKVEEIARALAK